MELFNLIAELTFRLGITLGVGASTFALTFFLLALTDGNIDSSEKRFMHAVYFVLRIGMFLIALGLFASLFGEMFSPPLQYTVQWILLGIIILNAILMTVHWMPMKYGPVIAGGSWYSLFFATYLPIYEYSLTTIAVAYGLFLVALYVLLRYLQKLLHPQT